MNIKKYFAGKGNNSFDHIPSNSLLFLCVIHFNQSPQTIYIYIYMRYNTNQQNKIYTIQYNIHSTYWWKLEYRLDDRFIISIKIDNIKFWICCYKFWSTEANRSITNIMYELESKQFDLRATHVERESIKSANFDLIIWKNWTYCSMTLSVNFSYNIH